MPLMQSSYILACSVHYLPMADEPQPLNRLHMAYKTHRFDEVGY